MPLAQQPKDIESYELNDNEVKILWLKYDPVSGEFLGIEYCIALATVRNDQDEQFFRLWIPQRELKGALFNQKSEDFEQL